VDSRRLVSGAFKRNKSTLSFVVLISFVIIISSTAWHTLAFSDADFLGKPEVQGYENALDNVAVMDEWSRTQYYWSNNLSVAGMYAATTPGNFGFNTGIYSDYIIGESFAYWYHQEGATGLVAFSGSVFVHGLLELTAVFIITAASLRLAWNFWKWMGSTLVVFVGRGEGLSARSLPKKSSRLEREYRKRRGVIRQHLTDFLVLVLVGAFLIFLAAPVEAYVSPKVGGSFYLAPALGVVFLVFAGLWYTFLVARGFGAMRKDFKLIFGELKLGSKGKRRPSQFSFFILTVFFLLTMFRLMF